jgi:uncharacterized RmlC-like cupin family protein
MSDSVRTTCRIVRPGHTAYDGKQGLSYFEGARQSPFPRLRLSRLSIPKKSIPASPPAWTSHPR